MMSKNVYSVGQVNAYIKQMFAEDFLLPQLSVKGEVSNCKYHTSGHIYFTLKDEQGAINAILFKGNRAKGLRFHLKDGDRVVVSGSVSVYEKGGTYQIYVREVSLDGAGELYLRFEQLKQELSEMGMFAPEYKKPIPRYARRIGIVTAPTGAAIQDMIQIAHRRNPFVELVLCPAKVQGEGAAESVTSAIACLDEMNLDVLIVGRGGGSIEDLWTFNEEEVARAIFACNTPVISAVGHETDTTICDYVADLRAPTPSAAAEQAVFSYQDWQETLEQYAGLFYRAWQRKWENVRTQIESFERQLRYLSPAMRLDEKRQATLLLEQRLAGRMQQILFQKKQELELMAGRLDGLSPVKKLAQGYSCTQDKAGRTIHSIYQVQEGENVTIHLSDGVLHANILSRSEENRWKN